MDMGGLALSLRLRIAPHKMAASRGSPLCSHIAARLSMHFTVTMKVNFGFAGAPGNCP
jgi:hypothetical protein